MPIITVNKELITKQKRSSKWYLRDEDAFVCVVMWVATKTVNATADRDP